MATSSVFRGCLSSSLLHSRWELTLQHRAKCGPPRFSTRLVRQATTTRPNGGCEKQMRSKNPGKGRGSGEGATALLGRPCKLGHPLATRHRKIAGLRIALDHDGWWRLARTGDLSAAGAAFFGGCKVGAPRNKRRPRGTANAARGSGAKEDTVVDTE